MVRRTSIVGLALTSIAPFGGCNGAGVTKLTDVPLAVVPITLPVADAGAVQVGLRLMAAISVQGHGPIEATVDTGSAGLQLLASLLPQETLSSLGNTGNLIESTFPESGIHAVGYIANARVSFGDATTPPIPVAVLESLSCTARSPCDTDAGSLATFLFNGAPALLGVGMRNSSVGGFGNPIAQLPGEPPFIIEAPSFGGDGGILRIAPTSAEIAAYKTLQLKNDSGAPLLNGVAAWNDLAVPACVEDETTSTSYCGNALLDTGTPVVEINWSGIAGYSEVSTGTRLSVVVGTSGDSLGGFEVAVADPAQFGWDFFLRGPPVADLGNLLILGLPLFSRFDVLFDQAQGRIGLLAH